MINKLAVFFCNSQISNNIQNFKANMNIIGKNNKKV